MKQALFCCLASLVLGMLPVPGSALVGSRHAQSAGPGRLAGVVPVGLLLQLTDVHISAMEGPAGDPQRAADLLSLSSGLLARWPLAAAMLTGDLTEAKNVYGKGRQDEREWQTYNNVWNALSSVGGVPQGQIYDIRGNHDTFNSGPRCGTADFYCRYSARAARVGAGGSVTARASSSSSSSSAAAAAAAGGGDRRRLSTFLYGASAASGRGPRDRVFVDPVYSRVAATAATDGSAGGSNSNRSNSSNGGGADTSCPLAIVVGVDASLDPGLRSPTNFLGVVSTAVLGDLDEQLAASVADMRAAGCNPPYIAYGHYPLSTIAYPSHRTDHSGASTVQDILVRHGVSAYLAGHLHGAFGRKLHRLHRAPAVNSAAAAGRGSAAESESLKGAARVNSALAAMAASKGGNGPAGHMLELEMVDWKYARTVRLLTVDPAAGGALGFADFRYVPPAPEPLTVTAMTTARRQLKQDDVVGWLERGLTSTSPLEPFDSTCSIGAYLPLITCPPDARYSPQLTTAPFEYGTGCSAAAGSSNSSGALTAIVRVILLPMSAAVPSAPNGSVYLNWACDGAGAGSHYLSGQVQMRLEVTAASYSTYTADLLSNDGGAAAGKAGGPPVGLGDLRSCPPGQISVQAVVLGGGDGDHRLNGRDDASDSASAMRLLHWRLPLETVHQAPTGAVRDVFWIAVERISAGDGADGGRRDGPSVATVLPAPLQQTRLEWLVMHVAWHRFGLIAFVAQWCVLILGMLVAPSAAGLVRARRLGHQGIWRQQQKHQQRRRSRCSDPGSCESGDETELGELMIAAAPMALPQAGGPVTPSRQLDWTAEAISTSVRLGRVGGGVIGGVKSTALKRNSSGSSSGCGGDAWTSGLAAAAATSKDVRKSPLRPDDGGSGGGGGGASCVREAMPLRSTALPAATAEEGNGRGSAAVHRVLCTVLGIVRRWMLWPLRDLAELAEHRDPLPWVMLVLYGTFLAVGPWLVAEFVDSPSDGAGPQPVWSGYGILTAYGIYMRPAATNAGSHPEDTMNSKPLGWVQAPSQDHAVIINVVMLVCIAPSFLLCVSAAARLRRMAAAGTLCGSRFSRILSLRQMAGLCGIGLLNMGLCCKLWAGLGWLPILLSPGVGWVLPLLVGWLWLVSSRAAGA